VEFAIDKFDSEVARKKNETIKKNKKYGVYT